MGQVPSDRERQLIERYGVAGLRAKATRVLAEGDDASCTLLAEQLKREERHQGNPDDARPHAIAPSDVPSRRGSQVAATPQIPPTLSLPSGGGCATPRHR